jgi:hypothetical protein
MSATTVGLIVVPLCIFLLTVIYGGIRGSIRFAQYLVRSEEAQSSAADSLKNVSDRLNEYMSKNDGEIRSLDKRMTVAEYELEIKKLNKEAKS